jgi:hypothetical protein
MLPRLAKAKDPRRSEIELHEQTESGPEAKLLPVLIYLLMHVFCDHAREGFGSRAA